MTIHPSLIEHTLYHRLLEDHRLITVISILFGRARVTIGPLDYFYDDVW